MKLESQLYDLFDHIAEGVREMARDDERCCRFHCPGFPELPPLCDRCRRKLMGLRNYIDGYRGKYLVIIDD